MLTCGIKNIFFFINVKKISLESYEMQKHPNRLKRGIDMKTFKSKRGISKWYVGDCAMSGSDISYIHKHNVQPARKTNSEM